MHQAAQQQDEAKNWLILQNETSTIGLLQGMFSKNIMTFNPGWDRNCGTLPDFDDIRDIQRAHFELVRKYAIA